MFLLAINITYHILLLVAYFFVQNRQKSKIVKNRKLSNGVPGGVRTRDGQNGACFGHYIELIEHTIKYHIKY